MKKGLVLIVAVLLSGCSQAKVGSSSASQPKSDAPVRAEKLESTIAHSGGNPPPTPADTPRADNSATKGKWTQSGDPIDTSKFDGVIAEAEKALKARPDDESARKTLSEAYFDRGFALTEARQYASALGDFRRALKYDPSNEEAKKWIDQIISIYQMLKREYPKEGEEPPPLPFKKQK